MLSLVDRLSNPADAGSVNRTQDAFEADRIQIRQAQGVEQAALVDFLDGLSSQTRFLRFFVGGVPGSPAMLGVLAGARDDTDAVVATEQGAVIGHAMAVDTTTPGGTRLAEIGVVVADGRQGRGVGSALVRTLATRARSRGATTVVMDVLAENRRVLAMIADHWPAARCDRSAGQVTIHARLAGHEQDREQGQHRPGR